MAAEYRIQQVTYALAGAARRAPAAEVAFVFLEREDAIVTARVAAADEPALAGELRAAMDRLRTSAFDPRPSPRAAPTAARSTGSAPGRGLAELD